MERYASVIKLMQNNRCMSIQHLSASLVLFILSLPLSLAASPQLHIAGTNVENARGQVVLLRGLDVPSLEWTDTGDHIQQSVQIALTEWHANILRLPLSEDRWFGKAPGQTDGGAAYRKIVDGIVQTVSQHDAYVIADLHWSDMDQWGQNIGQHKMPDQHSLAFWQDCAKRYANNPTVLFDLYNEPHDISWDLWKNGGSVTEAPSHPKDAPSPADQTYTAPGMQKLLDTVRATGAKNVIVAGGPGWASDLSGLEKGDALSDPAGHGVIYANHVYPFGGETVPQWTKRIEAVTQKYPVIVSEFGSDPPGGHGLTGAQWVQAMLHELQTHHWNWTAWCLHPAASPCLISDWNYTPTPYFGAFVKEALLGTLPPYSPPPAPTGNEVVYDDSLQNFWMEAGWAKLDYANTALIHSGTASIKVSADAYQALSLRHDPFDSSRFRSLSFWINGGDTGGQILKVQAVLEGKPQTEFHLLPLQAHVWQQVTIPLQVLDVADKPNMTGFWIQDLSGKPAPPFFVDDISLQAIKP